MRLVRGVVQHYAWGDTSAIPNLLGLEPDGRPWAELWFGTHIGGASRVLDLGDDIDDDRSPSDDTGGSSIPLSSISGELPFLMKILAAAQPLSLQSHPSEEQARSGYARENRLNLPVSNSRRIYRDPFAKPELICALGRFEAFCGFRDVTATVQLLHSIGGGASTIARMVTDHDYQYTLRYLFSGDKSVEDLLSAIILACQKHASPSAQWATKLALSYPHDPAIAATLLLNYVVLKQGQALYLGPGNLHAYLSGQGVEVMGSSDNVVRCGLTNKNVDVQEFLSIVIARSITDPVIEATPMARTSAGLLWKYETPRAPFTLWIHQINGTEILRANTRELILCGSGQTDRLQRGEVCYLGPREELTLTGKATLFRVTESIT